MFVNHPGESFQLLDFFAVNLDLFIKTSENAGSVVLLQVGKFIPFTSIAELKNHR